MNTTSITTRDAENKKSEFNLSLGQRLPLLIGGLLLLTVTALGWLAYLQVKHANMSIGKERLSSLTTQLSSLFGQSAAAINAASHTAASQSSIINFLKDGSKADSALKSLDKLRIDSTWPQVDLFDINKRLVLRSITSQPLEQINIDSILSGMSSSPDSSLVGKIYQSGNSVIYPIITTVTNNRKITGFLVRWRLQTTTAKSLKQLSQLLGTNAQLYFGNHDGSLWTNLRETIASPPVSVAPGSSFFEYSRAGNDPVIAYSSFVPGTQWMILVEFSKNIILKSANEFLKWIISIGAFIVIAGFFLAWLFSRRITTPLKKLTAAASSIASGEFGAPVNISRNDELGKLAKAFNKMSGDLKLARQGLEEKVKQRTLELEAVNKELEAFSYSVSHDLRAPLRSINGYANILYEDYAAKLDEEAKRLSKKIISNGEKMGQLIDDLISFSQVARKEIKQNMVNMQDLVKSCCEELLSQTNPIKIKTDPLPFCKGDEGLLRQVWLNLIGNAIKYSSKKPEPCIEIGSFSDSTSHTYFVRDNGTGFDMRYADKLFGVFQRLHSDREFEGTGIGLALTKRIVNRHKGHIYAEGKVGEGACFYFKLPK